MSLVTALRPPGLTTLWIQFKTIIISRQGIKFLIYRQRLAKAQTSFDGAALSLGELIAGMCRHQGSLAQSEAEFRDRLAMVDQWEAGKSSSSQFCHQTSLVSLVARAAQAVAVTLLYTGWPQSFYETEHGHNLVNSDSRTGENYQYSFTKRTFVCK